MLLQELGIFKRMMRVLFDCAIVIAVVGTTSAIWEMVTSALGRLRADYEVIVIEGAGSPAESTSSSTT